MNRLNIALGTVTILWGLMCVVFGVLDSNSFTVMVGFSCIATGSFCAWTGTL